MTRQALDALMLDYLYDELTVAERARYEAALVEHPDVAETIAAHRATRASFAALPPAAPAPGLMSRVIAEANAAVAPAPPTPVGDGPARVGWLQRLARLFVQPAFATAAVAVLFVGVGIGLLGRDDLVRSGESQRLDSVTVSAPEPPSTSAIAPRHDAPADPGAVDLEALAREEAPAEDKALTLPDAPKAAEAKGRAADGGSVERKPGADEALDDRAVVRDAGTATPDKSKETVNSTRRADKVTKKAPRRPRAAANTGGAGVGGGGVGAVGGVVTGGSAGARTGAGARTDSASEQPAKDSEPSGGVPEVMLSSTGSNEGANYRGDDRDSAEVLRTAPRPVVRTASDSDHRDEGEAKSARTRERSLEKADDASTADKLADKAARELREAALWERYRELVEAGKLDEAERVLAQLEQLRGESVATRKARANLAERRERHHQASKPVEPVPAETLDSFE